MSETKGRSAVGAGTTAGDAAEEETAIESRAAEAEVDGMLESLRTTEAGPTGVTEPGTRPPAAAEGAQAVEAGPAPLRPERPRADLQHNQAGIGSRLDRK